MAKPSLKNQLLAEFKAHPAKSGVLALLLVVGGYLYVPILAGVVRGDAADGDASIPAVDRTPTPLAVALAANQPMAGQDPETQDWRAVADEIDADPRMRTNPDWATGESPFITAAPPPPKPAKPAQLPADVPLPVPTVSPTEAGLILTSTITGGRAAVALINGEPYRVGDEIRGDTDETYQLTAIADDHVTLSSAGKQYELAITTSPPMN